MNDAKCTWQRAMGVIGHQNMLCMGVVKHASNGCLLPSVVHNLNKCSVLVYPIASAEYTHPSSHTCLFACTK